MICWDSWNDLGWCGPSLGAIAALDVLGALEAVVILGPFRGLWADGLASPVVRAAFLRDLADLGALPALDGAGASEAVVTPEPLAGC